MTKSCLDNRMIMVHDKDFINYNIGAPQGSISRPMYWNIIKNELLRENRGHNNYQIIAFVDDLLVILIANSSFQFRILVDESLK